MTSGLGSLGFRVRGLGFGVLRWGSGFRAYLCLERYAYASAKQQMCVCVCVCVYICVYAHIYIYIYAHVYRFIYLEFLYVVCLFRDISISFFRQGYGVGA